MDGAGPVLQGLCAGVAPGPGLGAPGVPTASEARGVAVGEVVGPPEREPLGGPGQTQRVVVRLSDGADVLLSLRARSADDVWVVVVGGCCCCGGGGK